MNVHFLKQGVLKTHGLFSPLTGFCVIGTYSALKPHDLLDRDVLHTLGDLVPHPVST
jgi:hypothetical protein